MADDQNKTEEEIAAPEVQEENSDVQEQPAEAETEAESEGEGEAEQAQEKEEVAQNDSENPEIQTVSESDKSDDTENAEIQSPSESSEETEPETPKEPENPNAVNGKWYVVHTFAGHENRVATTLKQRIEAEHLENLIFDILVPTQDKIEIRGGKKETVKEKIFPGYILVKMILSDESWLAVRTTQGVTSFVGAGNKPTPISEAEVNTIVKFTTQGAQPTFKDVFMVDDTVKIVDGPFSEFIGKVDSVDKEKGRVRVLVSIFGRETPVELDFLQVQKL